MLHFDSHGRGPLECSEKTGQGMGSCSIELKTYHPPRAITDECPLFGKSRLCDEVKGANKPHAHQDFTITNQHSWGKGPRRNRMAVEQWSPLHCTTPLLAWREGWCFVRPGFRLGSGGWMDVFTIEGGGPQRATRHAPSPATLHVFDTLHAPTRPDICLHDSSSI